MGRSGDSAGEVWGGFKSFHQNSAQVSSANFSLSSPHLAAPNVSFKIRKPTYAIFRVYARADAIDYEIKIVRTTEARHSGARRKRA